MGKILHVLQDLQIQAPGLGANLGTAGRCGKQRQGAQQGQEGGCKALLGTARSIRLFSAGRAGASEHCKAPVKSLAAGKAGIWMVALEKIPSTALDAELQGGPSANMRGSSAQS